MPCGTTFDFDYAETAVVRGTLNSLDGAGHLEAGGMPYDGSGAIGVGDGTQRVSRCDLKWSY